MNFIHGTYSRCHFKIKIANVRWKLKVFLFHGFQEFRKFQSGRKISIKKIILIHFIVIIILCITLGAPAALVCIGFDIFIKRWTISFGCNHLSFKWVQVRISHLPWLWAEPNRAIASWSLNEIEDIKLWDFAKPNSKRVKKTKHFNPSCSPFTANKHVWH